MLAVPVLVMLLRSREVVVRRLRGGRGEVEDEQVSRRWAERWRGRARQPQPSLIPGRRGPKPVSQLLVRGSAQRDGARVAPLGGRNAVDGAGRGGFGAGRRRRSARRRGDQKKTKGSASGLSRAYASTRAHSLKRSERGGPTRVHDGYASVFDIRRASRCAHSITAHWREPHLNVLSRGRSKMRRGSLDTRRATRGSRLSAVGQSGTTGKARIVGGTAAESCRYADGRDLRRAVASVLVKRRRLYARNEVASSAAASCRCTASAEMPVKRVIATDRP